MVQKFKINLAAVSILFSIFATQLAFAQDAEKKDASDSEPALVSSKNERLVSISLGAGLISVKGIDRNPPTGRVHRINTDFLQSRLNWNLTGQLIYGPEDRFGYVLGAAVMRHHSVTGDNFYRSHALCGFVMGTLKIPTSAEMFTVGLGPLVSLNLEQNVDAGNTKLWPFFFGGLLETKFGLRRSKTWAPFFTFRATAQAIPTREYVALFGLYTLSGNVGIEMPY